MGLSVFALATGISGHGTALAAEEWRPKQPIRLIVPYPPGGGTDVAARLMANSIQDLGGQPMVVENRAGANGVIGANMAYAAAPDGTTLFFGVSDIISTTPHVNPKVIKFDPNNFPAVAPVGRGGYVLVSNASKPTQSVEEILKAVRAPNSTLSYGHWGAGSMSQMAMEQFKMNAEIPQLMEVPFGGSAALLNAVLGDHVDYAFIPPGLAVSGGDKLRMYAASSAERIPMLPELPTLRELGFDTEAETLYGVFAPPGTPAHIIEYLNREILKVTKEKAFVDRLVELGYSASPMSPAEMDARVRAENKQWGEIVEKANLTID